MLPNPTTAKSRRSSNPVLAEGKGKRKATAEKSGAVEVAGGMMGSLFSLGGMSCDGSNAADYGEGREKKRG